MVWVASELFCAKQKKNPSQQLHSFFSDTRLVLSISVFVLLIMFVLGTVHVCLWAFVCVWDWGGVLRFCCWCLKSPCLSLYQADSTTLTWPWAVGWLRLLHASFIPPRTTPSICPPDRLGTQSAMCLQRQRPRVRGTGGFWWELGKVAMLLLYVGQK